MFKLFCQKCGTKLAEGADFCASCGASVKQSPNAASIKEEDLSALRNCHTYFNKIRDTYAEYEDYRLKRYWLDNPAALPEEYDNSLFRILFYIVGIIACLIFYYSKPDVTYVTSKGGFINIIFIVLPVWVFIRVVMRKKHIRKQYDVLRGLVVQHYEGYKNCPLVFGYCNPLIIETLINLIESRRADSLKEAINLYEDNITKDEMMRLQRKTVFHSQMAAAKQ